jgi:ectoine hydroxylase-related dioxygenase (phytanoyl-CoA dioxygenase family)
VSALRRRLDCDGLVLLEDALDAERVARLTSAVDRIWRERGGGSALHLLGFVGFDESFVELVDHPAALPLVCEVLGCNVFVYHCHLDVHPPLQRRPAPVWHQDGGRQNVELDAPRPQLSLKVAYFLTDVDEPEQGAMWLIRGSHRRDWLERPQNGSIRPPDAEPLLVRAGTIVVFDRRLWHARGDNLSCRTRKALFYAYTHRWIRPRDELLGVDDDLLARQDPVRRQLLGAGTGPIGYWIPTDDDVPLARRYKGDDRAWMTSAAS